jgi:hypothetical protein
MDSVSQSRMLSEQEAARYLGIAPQTLRQQRSEGARSNRLPLVPFVRMGRTIRYDVKDLDDFIAAHRVTSERGQG